MLNIIVLIKQVTDTGTQVEIADDGVGIAMEDVKWSLNPYDEMAVEEALRIKERLDDVAVTAVCAGPERVEESLRVACAMGVDEVIRIDDETGPEVCGAVDPYTTARILAAALKGIPFDLIITGQRAVDDDSCQVPAFVAQMLGIAMIAAVIKEEIAAGRICCEQATDAGTLVLETPLPALITTQKGLNEPRYPNMRAIIKARKRAIDERTLEEIGVDPATVGATGARVKIRALQYPPSRGGGKIIDGATAGAKAAELVRLLKEEARVL